MKISIIIAIPLFLFAGVIFLSRGYFMEEVNYTPSKQQLVEVNESVIKKKVFLNDITQQNSIDWGKDIKSNFPTIEGKILVYSQKPNDLEIFLLSKQGDIQNHLNIESDTYLLKFYSEKLDGVFFEENSESGLWEMYLLQKDSLNLLTRIQKDSEPIDYFYDAKNRIFFLLTKDNKEKFYISRLDLKGEMNTIYETHSLQSDSKILNSDSLSVFIQSGKDCYKLNQADKSLTSVACKSINQNAYGWILDWQTKSSNIYENNFQEKIIVNYPDRTVTQNLSTTLETISFLNFTKQKFSYVVYDVLQGNVQLQGVFSQTIGANELQSREKLSDTLPPASVQDIFMVDEELFAISKLNQKSILYKFIDSPLSYTSSNWVKVLEVEGELSKF